MPSEGIKVGDECCCRVVGQAAGGGAAAAATLVEEDDSVVLRVEESPAGFLTAQCEQIIWIDVSGAVDDGFR